MKRCVGLPGDTLQIKEGQVYIDGQAIENPEGLQFNYFVQTTGPLIPENLPPARSSPKTSSASWASAWTTSG